ncbi:MAG: GatB/YqeY domain-containing protein [Candidatus Omnitrophica bacterium]|nr:GatB/YqeY domain-containing protein [Candidatus Omnitrophota bacterium]MDD5430590.1 GatB/YqeY domain-containing protein [Candidatus Omnitrophota bacterium]
MQLEDKIYQDYVAALKARDKDRSVFLSFLRADFKNLAIDLKTQKLSDAQAQEVLKKQQKRLRDSKENIVKSGRKDLIQNLENELSILSGYLPRPLSEEELSRIIDKIVKDTGASSMKDMGKVMKEALEQVGAKADSKTVSELVKKRLTSN